MEASKITVLDIRAEVEAIDPRYLEFLEEVE